MGSAYKEGRPQSLVERDETIMQKALGELQK